MHGGLQEIHQALEHRHIVEGLDLANGHHHASIGASEIDREGAVCGQVRGHRRFGTEFFAGGASHVQPRFDWRALQQRQRPVRQEIDRGACAENGRRVSEDDGAIAEDA